MTTLASSAPHLADADKLNLDSQYSITPDHVRFYQEHGYIKLKNVLLPQVLQHYGREITRKVIELCTMDVPMEKRSTYQKAFLQVCNLWPQSDVVKEFVFSKRLARIAADLMQVSGVRIYHDQALYKEKGGGITPWHADQFYWPLSTDKTCTVWIPLQKTPKEMGPLAFAARSQRFTFGRDLGISDDSEKLIADAMAKAGFDYTDDPFDLGEVSYHSGWTFHRAGPNLTDTAREVMTIIYMDENQTVMEPRNNNQQMDHKNWLPGTVAGGPCDSPLNPVLFHRD